MGDLVNHTVDLRHLQRRLQSRGGFVDWAFDRILPRLSGQLVPKSADCARNTTGFGEQGRIKSPPSVFAKKMLWVGELAGCLSTNEKGEEGL